MSEPNELLGLHHVAIATSDVAAAVAFYRDVLGFGSIERPAFNFAGAWLFNYGIQVHIIENAPRVAGEAIDPRADHLAFATSDLDAVEARLAARNIRYFRQVNAGGIPQIFFHDPDGRHIEIGMYPPTPRAIADERA